MKFPKQELNIDTYIQTIKELLNDNSCHIFIDTNIISQLYRLNEEARGNFYEWVESCGNRFHIPNWSVHEYSKRVTSHNTIDYLSELTKAKTYSKELTNISRFIKEYVGDSLIEGSTYEGRKDSLFQDIDSVVINFAKIAQAINKNITEHQQKVHKEVLERLNIYTLNSNIYEIMRNLYLEHDLRFDGKIPPGFKDSDKTSNRIGDLIIWKEILDFCNKEELKRENAKVIFISRDLKPDMVYKPTIQKRDNHTINESDKIEIAQESLVYEFKLTTDSEDFYLISFLTLVQILASKYKKLATSFQIATEQENAQIVLEEINCISNEITNTNDTNDVINEIEIELLQGDNTSETETSKNPIKYSEYALEDYYYDTSKEPTSINECIENLKTYNWYKQNPAIDKLHKLSFNKLENTQQNRNSFFVLGRNILQSADGTSGSAMSFLDNLHSSISNWPKHFQQAFIDGCLYEVFFDSLGKIRSIAFKSSYFQTVFEEVKKMKIEKPFDFINEELKEITSRFVPKIDCDKKYKFEFTFGKKDEFNNIKTTSLKINNIDVSNTFKLDYGHISLDLSNINKELASYYAIPEENIELTPLPNEVNVVYFIDE